MSAIILYPLMTERSHDFEIQNKIAFCVDIRANKPKIKAEVERLYEVKVAKVNTMIRPDGTKLAIVRLADGFSVSDLMVKLGLI